jgi:hypothetical protein
MLSGIPYVTLKAIKWQCGFGEKMKIEFAYVISTLLLLSACNISGPARSEQNKALDQKIDLETSLPQFTESPRQDGTVFSLDELNMQEAIEPQCYTNSGIMYRSWTPVGPNINWMSSDIYVPSIPERVRYGPEAAFFYSGGWSDRNKALDAGFAQFQFGDKKDWAPIFSAETVELENANPRLNGRILHLKASQNINFQFYLGNESLNIVVSGKNGMPVKWNEYKKENNRLSFFKEVIQGKDESYLFSSSALNNSMSQNGWYANGTGAIFKIMSTIGQDGLESGFKENINNELRPLKLTHPYGGAGGNVVFEGAKFSNTYYGNRRSDNDIDKIEWNNSTSKECVFPIGVVKKDKSNPRIEYVGLPKIN